MPDDRWSAFIVERLAAHDNPDDIVLELCQQGGLSWPRAEELVERVRQENETAITRRQSPFLAVIAFVLFVGGVALIGFSTYSVVESLEHYLSMADSGQSVLDAVNLPGILFYLSDSASGLLVMWFGGAAMMLGSLTGMRRVWLGILGA